MSPIEALELALAKEKEAISIYKKFQVEFSIVKDMFLFLENEEQKHKSLIEKKISELMSK